MEPSLTGWSLSLSCEASPRCPPSSWSSPTSPLVTWQQCNVRCLFSRLPLLLLSPPCAGLPRAVQASRCKQGRNRGAARAQDHPQEHRLGPGRRLNIQPWLHLGRPQPVARHLPRVPALISWCVCTPGWHWHQPANIAHGPSNNLAFTNRAVKLVFILANDDD